MLLTATVMHLLNNNMSVSLKFILCTPWKKDPTLQKTRDPNFPLTISNAVSFLLVSYSNKTSFLLIICDVLAVAENITYVVSSCHTI